LLQEVLPIIAQEDPYMIRLLDQQIYIKIVKMIAMGWVEGVKSSFLFVIYEFVGEYGEQRNKYLGFKIALGVKIFEGVPHKTKRA